MVLSYLCVLIGTFQASIEVEADTYCRLQHVITSTWLHAGDGKIDMHTHFHAYIHTHSHTHLYIYINQSAMLHLFIRLIN